MCETMQSLCLARRTLELVIILIDDLLFVQNYAPKDLEIFCCSCIFFVIKYEGDFPQQLYEFMSSFNEQHSADRQILLETELDILLLSPSHFALCSTYSEYVLSLVEIFGEVYDERTLQLLHHDTLTRLVCSSGRLTLDFLIIFPLLVIIHDTTNFESLFRTASSLLKKKGMVHNLSSQRFKMYIYQYLSYVGLSKVNFL